MLKNSSYQLNSEKDKDNIFNIKNILVPTTKAGARSSKAVYFLNTLNDVSAKLSKNNSIKNLGTVLLQNRSDKRFKTKFDSVKNLSPERINTSIRNNPKMGSKKNFDNLISMGNLAGNTKSTTLTNNDYLKTHTLLKKSTNIIKKEYRLKELKKTYTHGVEDFLKLMERDKKINNLGTTSITNEEKEIKDGIDSNKEQRENKERSDSKKLSYVFNNNNLNEIKEINENELDRMTTLGFKRYDKSLKTLSSHNSSIDGIDLREYNYSRKQSMENSSIMSTIKNENLIDLHNNEIKKDSLKVESNKILQNLHNINNTGEGQSGKELKVVPEFEAKINRPIVKKDSIFKKVMEKQNDKDKQDKDKQSDKVLHTNSNKTPKIVLSEKNINTKDHTNFNNDLNSNLNLNPKFNTKQNYNININNNLNNSKLFNNNVINLKPTLNTNLINNMNNLIKTKSPMSVNKNNIIKFEKVAEKVEKVDKKFSGESKEKSNEKIQKIEKSVEKSIEKSTEKTIEKTNASPKKSITKNVLMSHMTNIKPTVDDIKNSFLKLFDKIDFNNFLEKVSKDELLKLEYFEFKLVSNKSEFNCDIKNSKSAKKLNKEFTIRLESPKELLDNKESTVNIENKISCEQLNNSKTEFEKLIAIQSDIVEQNEKEKIERSLSLKKNNIDHDNNNNLIKIFESENLKLKQQELDWKEIVENTIKGNFERSLKMLLDKGKIHSLFFIFYYLLL